MSGIPSRMDPASPGGHSSLTSKLVGPGHAETVHASEKYNKTGLLAAHIASLHDAYVLERGLLPGTSLPDSEAPAIPPVYAESPWKDFKLLKLADMKVGKTHRRQALEGHLCAKSLKVTSVVNVLEEDSGLATKLILTNALPMRASMAQAQHCYPEGSRVTVRDPYLTRFPDGIVGVLVERPTDIAFLSRPESTGDNGHMIYGAVGYEDEHAHSRDHGDFSRKIHLFEQEMKKVELAQQESLESRRMSGMFQRPVLHHREDHHYSHGARHSPSKGPQSPVKEFRKAVAAEAKPVVVDRLRDSPVVESPKHMPSPLSPVLLAQVEEAHVEVPVKQGLLNESVEEPTTPKAEERRGAKDIETLEEESVESVPDTLPKSLEREKGTPPQSVATEEPEVPEVVEQPEASPAVEPEVTEAAEHQPEVSLAAEPEVHEVAEQHPEVSPAAEQEAAEISEQREPSLATESEVHEVSEQPEAFLATEQEVREVSELPEASPAAEAETPEVAEQPKVSVAVEAETPEVAEQPKVSAAVESEAPEVIEQPEISAAVEPETSKVAEQSEVSAAAEKLVESEQNSIEPPVAEASVSSNENGTSNELLESRNGETEAADTKRPPVRKQFHRSDSLLAVQDVEDTKARALGASTSTAAAAAASVAGAAAGAAAVASSRDEHAAAKAEESSIPDVKVDEVVAPVSKTDSPATTATDKPAPPPPKPASASDSHSANDLRVLGNLMFGEEKFAEAADLYTRSIAIAEAEEHRQGKLVRNSEIILGYSNRAEAYIRLQEFGKALADAKKALSRDPSHLKSLFRKGRALLGLSQYEQALTTLQAAAPRAPTDRDLQAALHESSTGVQQSCHGHYDLAHYYLKGKQAGETPFSADYVGPVVVADVGRGRGRGLLLTKDVEAGELLLVSNPMAYLPLPDGGQSRREISQAFVDGKVQEGFRNVFEIAHQKGLEKLPTLWDGEKALPAPSVHQTDAETGKHELHLDHARVRRIIQLNAINGDATMGWKNLPGSGEQDKKVEHWGLWWLPSFINHSCLPSASVILVGKALFLFAARDLRAGEEVTRSYFDIFQPLDQRKELSAKGWGFVCFCPRCKLEDALHTSLSKVTEQYTKLMELASKSKSEFGTDEQLTDTQTSAALKFFHRLESKLKDFKLNSAENNWVRSSFLHYIDMINGDHELHTHLESIVEALVTVCPGSETTLHMAVVAKDSAKRTFGKKSPQFKAGNHRALNICRFTYGKQKVSVLQSIVDKNDYQS